MMRFFIIFLTTSFIVALLLIFLSLLMMVAISTDAYIHERIFDKIKYTPNPSRITPAWNERGKG